MLQAKSRPRLDDVAFVKGIDGKEHDREVDKQQNKSDKRPFENAF